MYLRRRTEHSTDNFDAAACSSYGGTPCEEAPVEQCPPVDFTFVNTGVNMTLFAPFGAGLSGTIGAFVDDMCVGSAEYDGGPLQIAVMGDDSDSPETDGALDGEIVTLYFKNSDGVYVTETSFEYSLMLLRLFKIFLLIYSVLVIKILKVVWTAII